MKHKSIKINVIASMLVFSILMLSLLWLFQIVFLDSFYKSIKLNDIGKEAQKLAICVANWDIDGVMRIVDKRGDLEVEISAPAVGSVFISKSMYSGSQRYTERSYYTERQRQFYRQKAAENSGMYIEQIAGENRETILYSMIVKTKTADDVLLLVSSDITPVSATVATLRIQLAYISVIVIVLAGGIALFLSKYISKPIEKLSESAKHLGSGSYNADFNVKGYSEIETLSSILSNASAELNRTEHLRQELIANVSHDLRTPLTLISGYAELMRDIPRENTAENMQIIIDEAKRLTSLVTNMLDLSRIESGVQSINLQSFNLTQRVREIIARFSKFCESEGYTIIFERDTDIFISADPALIEQVLYNFITNAVNHAGEDKLVVVRQIAHNNSVRIEVTDTGTGIAKEHINDIWDRYYKIDEQHKRGKLGTGLGLSIVKAILEKHPGVSYGVESEPQKGSTFWFAYPLQT